MKTVRRNLVLNSFFSLGQAMKGLKVIPSLYYRCFMLPLPEYGCVLPEFITLNKLRQTVKIFTNHLQ